jgi:hypothetical protein
MYSFVTLAGPHSIEVADHQPCTIRLALARHFGVTSERITIVPAEVPLVVVQPPYEIVHDPSSLTFRVPPQLLEFFEQYPLHTLDDECRKLMSMNAGFTELLLRHPELIHLDGLVQNPHPDAVAYASVFRSHAQYAADNQGAVEHIAQKLATHQCADDGCTGPEINWRKLSLNPRAVHLLRAFPNHVSWYHLGLNPCAEAIDWLAERPEEDWTCLSFNTHPRAMEVLRQHPDRIAWPHLSANPAAIDILVENMDRINWNRLNRNTNPRAIELLAKNPARIEWHALSHNRAAVAYLEQNLEHVRWDQLSQNPFAEPLLRQHPERIVDYMLTVNLSAVELQLERLQHMWLFDLVRPREWFERV